MCDIRLCKQARQHYETDKNPVTNKLKKRRNFLKSFKRETRLRYEGDE